MYWYLMHRYFGVYKLLRTCAHIPARDCHDPEQRRPACQKIDQGESLRPSISQAWQPFVSIRNVREHVVSPGTSSPTCSSHLPTSHPSGAYCRQPQVPRQIQVGSLVLTGLQGKNNSVYIAYLFSSGAPLTFSRMRPSRPSSLRRMSAAPVPMNPAQRHKFA